MLLLLVSVSSHGPARRDRCPPPPVPGRHTRSGRRAWRRGASLVRGGIGLEPTKLMCLQSAKRAYKRKHRNRENRFIKSPFCASLQKAPLFRSLCLGAHLGSEVDGTRHQRRSARCSRRLLS